MGFRSIARHKDKVVDSIVVERSDECGGSVWGGCDGSDGSHLGPLIR